MSNIQQLDDRLSALEKETTAGLKDRLKLNDRTPEQVAADEQKAREEAAAAKK